MNLSQECQFPDDRFLNSHCLHSDTRRTSGVHPVENLSSLPLVCQALGSQGRTGLAPRPVHDMVGGGHLFWGTVGGIWLFVIYSIIINSVAFMIQISLVTKVKKISLPDLSSSQPTGFPPWRPAMSPASYISFARDSRYIQGNNIYTFVNIYIHACIYKFIHMHTYICFLMQLLASCYFSLTMHLRNWSISDLSASSFVFMAVRYSVLWTDHNLFNRSPSDGYLDFQSFASFQQRGKKSSCA